MNEIAKAAEQASRWTWETWFAAMVIVIGILVFFGGRWLTAKHEQLVAQLAQGQESKEKLMREMITGSQETNKILIEALVRNTSVIEANIKVLNDLGQRPNIVHTHTV